MYNAILPIKMHIQYSASSLLTATNCFYIDILIYPQDFSSVLNNKLCPTLMLLCFNLHWEHSNVMCKEDERPLLCPFLH